MVALLLAVLMGGCYVETRDATDVSGAGATFNAVARTDDVPATFYFEYSNKPDFTAPQRTVEQGPFPPHLSQFALRQAVSLNPGSTFYVRACGYEVPATRACSGEVKVVHTPSCGSVTGNGVAEQDLTIDPGCQKVTEDSFDFNSSGPGGPTVAVIGSLPTSRVVDRVTVGDFGLSSACSSGSSAMVRLSLGEMPAFRLDGVQPMATTAPVAIPSSPGPLTFSLPPTLLRKGYGYLFTLALDSGCQFAKRSTWSHSGSTVASGSHRCAPGPSRYALRFWHVKLAADWAPCPGVEGAPTIAVPTNSDPSMPGGWLQGFETSNSTVIQTALRRGRGGEPGEVVAGGCDDSYGAAMVYWRDSPTQTGLSDWVCVYPQYEAPGSRVSDDWHWTSPWTSSSGSFPAGQVRDAYLKLYTNEDAAAAYRFEPVLRFDASEPWRPLDVDGFLRERTAGSASHQVCSGSDDCSPLAGVAGLSASSTPSSYIDIAGATGPNPNEAGAASSYQSPDAACRSGDRVECDTGLASAFYYVRTTHFGVAGYRFLDYWMFYRFNYAAPGPAGASLFNHEGDWESVSVAPSVSDDATFDFAGFSQHGAYYVYLREVLRCGDSPTSGMPSAGSCGAEQGVHYGRRIHTMVANGTHANYTTPCSEDFIGITCSSNSDFGKERGYDGSRVWGNAFSDDPGTAVRPLPPQSENPALWAGDWADWPGRWGTSGLDVESPRSPLLQRLDNKCASVDNPSCPVVPGASGSRRKRGATAYQSPLASAAQSCLAWMGPGIAATECKPRELRVAVRGGKLGLQRFGRFRVAGRRRSIATRRGITQLAGPALAPGARVQPSGEKAFITLRVIDRRRRREYLATFSSEALRKAYRRREKRTGRGAVGGGLRVSLLAVGHGRTASVRLGRVRATRQIALRAPPR